MQPQDTLPYKLVVQQSILLDWMTSCSCDFTVVLTNNHRVKYKFGTILYRFHNAIVRNMGSH